MTDRQYVQFPVPVEFVAQVTMLLADLERGVAPTGAASAVVGHAAANKSITTGSNTTVRRNPGIIWSDTGYDTFYVGKSISRNRIRKFIDALPVGEESAATTSMLATATGIKDTEIRAALSWLTKFINSNPSAYSSDSWPFGWKVGKQVDPNNPHEFHYWLSGEQKDAWRSMLERFLYRDGNDPSVTEV